MAVNRELFEAKVDRAGEHHVWTGAVDESGTGQFKVDGRVRSPAAIAWELAHGEVPVGHRAQSCPDERLCIHPDHIRLRRYGSPKAKTTKRAERGGGSVREIAPGKWKLTTDAGRDSGVAADASPAPFEVASGTPSAPFPSSSPRSSQVNVDTLTSLATGKVVVGETASDAPDQ